MYISPLHAYRVREWSTLTPTTFAVTRSRTTTADAATHPTGSNAAFPGILADQYLKKKKNIY
jgi:hypothetical protein